MVISNSYCVCVCVRVCVCVCVWKDKRKGETEEFTQENCPTFRQKLEFDAIWLPI